MRLIDPQPMDTLPESGEVFVRFIDNISLADGWEPYTDEWGIQAIRNVSGLGRYIFYAWAYTATTEPDEQPTNTPTP
jgi:hypothetical protein